MRSLYTRVVITCLAAALVSLLAALTVFVLVGRDRYNANFRALGRVELDLAIMSYQHGGPEELRQYVARLDRDFASVHYFVDRDGVDLVTGEDRSALWPPLDNPNDRPWAGVRKLVMYLEGTQSVSVNRSADGRYAMIAEAAPWITARTQLPYYVAILFIGCLFQGLAAVYVIRALRAIADATEQFGNGDLEVRVAIAPRRDEVGKLARAFNAMADHVRELVGAQRRLIQDISHELRSPLARLAFATELSRTAVDRDAAADEIRRQVDCLAKLVGELLQLSRVEGEQKVDFTAEVCVDPVVRTVAVESRLNAEEHQSRLVVTGESCRICRGDEALMSRVFDNLVRNALQYSPPQHDVEIHICDLDRAVSVSVRDYGPGVPDSMRERIFEPFFRVDGSRQFSTGGAGLGLAIVKRIVVAHHGTIRVENVNPGLRMTVTFPTLDRPRLDVQSMRSLQGSRLLVES
jgi:two-component system sensor histidine kinase CpxA